MHMRIMDGMRTYESKYESWTRKQIFLLEGLARNEHLSRTCDKLSGSVSLS